MAKKKYSKLKFVKIEHIISNKPLSVTTDLTLTTLKQSGRRFACKTSRAKQHPCMQSTARKLSIKQLKIVLKDSVRNKWLQPRDLFWISKRVSLKVDFYGRVILTCGRNYKVKVNVKISNQSCFPALGKVCMLLVWLLASTGRYFASLHLLLEKLGHIASLCCFISVIFNALPNHSALLTMGKYSPTSPYGHHCIMGS